MKRRLTGIKIDLFNVCCTSFDGYGFSILGLGWEHTGKISYFDQRDLFYINLRKQFERGGVKWRISFCLVFFRIGPFFRVIRPENPTHCSNCGEPIENKSNWPYCSEICSW